MACFTANAAPIHRAALVLWPSAWPGAPATIGSCSGAPGVCEPPGRASYSTCIAMTGWPEP